MFVAGSRLCAVCESAHLPLHSLPDGPERLEVHDVKVCLVVTLSDAASGLELLMHAEVLLKYLAVVVHQNVNDVGWTVGDFNVAVNHAVQVETLVLVHVDSQDEDRAMAASACLDDWKLRDVDWLERAALGLSEPLVVRNLFRKLTFKVDWQLDGLHPRWSQRACHGCVGLVQHILVCAFLTRQCVEMIVKCIWMLALMVLVAFFSLLLVGYSLHFKLHVLKVGRPNFSTAVVVAWSD